jgi:hypothetical protein
MFFAIRRVTTFDTIPLSPFNWEMSERVVSLSQSLIETSGVPEDERLS